MCHLTFFYYIHSFYIPTKKKKKYSVFVILFSEFTHYIIQGLFTYFIIYGLAPVPSPSLILVPSLSETTGRKPKVEVALASNKIPAE